MSQNPVPAGYHTVTPYLVVPDLPALLAFLESVLDAVVTERLTMPDGVVAHAEVRIGDSMVMVGQGRDEWPAAPGNLYLYVPDPDGLYAKALEAGSQSLQEPHDAPYGDRMGGVRDPWGNVWWFGARRETVSPDEVARRMVAGG